MQGTLLQELSDLFILTGKYSLQREHSVTMWVRSTLTLRKVSALQNLCGLEAHLAQLALCKHAHAQWRQSDYADCWPQNR